MRKAAELEKVMQCVTLIRVAAKYGERKRVIELWRHVRQHLLPYLLSRRFSLRKKVGAAAVSVCPYALLKGR